MTAEKSGNKSFVSKILFIIGIIIILILLAWAVINFIPMVFSSLANVSSSIGKKVTSSSDEITVLANDNDLNTGERFSIYWRFTPKEAGLYSLSYDCINGVNFDIHVARDTKRLICNLPITLPKDTVNVDLTVYNTNVDSFVDVPIKVHFTSESDITDPSSTGQTVITVRNEASVTANNTTNGELSSATITSQSAPEKDTAQTTNTTPQSQTTTQYVTPTFTTPTRPDLAVSNLYAYPNQSAFQFDVYNIGGQSSGTWYFSYTDPSENNTLQYSPAQVSLAPGQGIRLSLAFNTQRNSSEVVTVYADPTNLISENSENNNSGAVTLKGRRIIIDDNDRDNDYENDLSDLNIRDLEVGRIDGGRFVSDNTLNSGDKVAVRFEVRNIGDRSTGSWKFEIRGTPYDDGDIYRSSSQSALSSGQTREIILELGNADKGTFNLQVKLDSDNSVREERENNNDDSVRLTVS